MSAAPPFGALLGRISFYLAPPEHRKRAISNLGAAFPEKSGEEIRSLAIRAFENQGRNLFELLLYPRMNSGNIIGKVEFAGRENFEKAFAKGKGVFMLAAHFGNWELLGAALALYGIPINAIARSVYIGELDEVLNGLRESKGIKVIKRGDNDSPRDILKALKRNEVIALIIDQNTKHIPGVYVDFFGRPAYTPLGLAQLALRTGAPVVPGFMVRVGDRHRIEIGEQIEIVNTGDIESDIRANTQIFTGIIESYVRKYPGQWVWFHKRWD